MAGNNDGVRLRPGRPLGVEGGRAFSFPASCCDMLFDRRRVFPLIARRLAGRADGDSGSMEEDEDADRFSDRRREEGRNEAAAGGEDGGMAS